MVIVAVAVVSALAGAGVTTLVRGDDNGAGQNVSGIDTTSTGAASPRGELTGPASSVVSGPVATTADAESTTPPRSSVVTVTPSTASSPSTPVTVKTSTFPPTTAEHIAPAGTAVTDGNLRFTVTSFTCGVAVVVPEATDVKAHGVLCLAALNIENVGHEEANYQPASQALQFKYNGLPLASDMWFTFWANHTPDWYTQTHSDPGIVTHLDPGASATQNLVFDVPPEDDYKHAYIELHEFDGGPGVLTATNYVQS